jgi:hypothetical protein
MGIVVKIHVPIHPPAVYAAWDLKLIGILLALYPTADHGLAGLLPRSGGL